jgi:hypothetical protein
MRLVRRSPWFAGILLVLATPASASSWQKVAAQGEDDPDGRPYGSLILAPVIADDGSVLFADVPSDPLPNPPRYSLWRWSEAGGVEPLATIVAPPSSAIGWQLPEPGAPLAGDGALAALAFLALGRRSKAARVARQVVAAGALLAASSPASALTWTRLIGAGDLAPGIEPETILQDAGVLSRIADDGTVGLVARTPLNQTVPRGLYRHTPGEGFELLAVAQAAGGAIDRFESLTMNRRGDVLLQGVRPGGDFPSPCEPGDLFVARQFLSVFEREGGERLVAEQLAPVAGMPGALWLGGLCGSEGCLGWSWNQPLLDESAEAAFAGVVTTGCGSSWRGLFGASGTGIETLAARLGDPAPGLPGAVLAGYDFQWSERALNGAGQLAFLAPLGDGGRALYRRDPGQVPTLLARTGEPALLADGAVFFDLAPAHLDAAGLPCFYAREFEGEFADPRVLWAPDGAGGIHRIAGGAAPAPGAPEGAVFEPIHRYAPPPLNAAGEVAVGLDVRLEGGEVAAALFGPDASERFTLRLLAGAPAAGIAGASFTAFEAFAIDDEREILFWARLEGDGIGTSNDEAWYKLHPGGALQLVLREGQLFEVEPGDWKPVERILAPAFDADLEHFAVRAGGASMSGAIFVTTVPEPCASAAGACAFVALGLLGSRRRAGVPIRSGCRSRPRRAS